MECPIISIYCTVYCEDSESVRVLNGNVFLIGAVENGTSSYLLPNSKKSVLQIVYKENNTLALSEKQTSKNPYAMISVINEQVTEGSVFRINQWKLKIHSISESNVLDAALMKKKYKLKIELKPENSDFSFDEEDLKVKFQFINGNWFVFGETGFWKYVHNAKNPESELCVSLDINNVLLRFGSSTFATLKICQY